MPLKLMETVEDICIQVFDKDSKTLLYSKGCEKIEGLNREAVIGKTIDELYTVKKTRDNPHGSIPLKVLETGQVMKDQHVTFITQSGKEVNVISSTYPIFEDDQVTVSAAICVFRDIGDFLQMAQTIQKLESDLAQEKINRKGNGTIYSFTDIIGQSDRTQHCIQLSKKASQSTAPVLIYGATGTGKEVFAQSIHNESIFGMGPFVAINCSAIPENLLESTLFGTCKGAFTGADETKGLFELAERGTLFLDEINSMSPHLQAKLLRALETKHIRKVGGNQEIPIRVRIISATNQNPLKLVRKGVLRDDFYYRLAVIQLPIPELKHRKEDIPELIQHFIRNHAHIVGKRITGISEETYEILLQHHWPGNVRELKHVIDQSIYLADYKDTILQPHHLPIYLNENGNNKKISPQYQMNRGSDIKTTLQVIEKQIILDELVKNKNNISQTAKALGMTRQNLQHKLKNYQV